MENNNFGQVKISNDVVATIAGLAALEVEGVETNTTFTDKILKNNGVKIQIEEEEVSLDVMVMIDYGVSIPEIALKIQENVKNTVETMTGLKVSQVNIHIQGISFKKEKTELEEAKKEAIQKFADYAAEHVPTTGNMRGSKEYRTLLVKVLTRRAWEVAGGMKDEH